MFSEASAAREGCPFWYYDDITECGRALYIDYYVPAGVLLGFLAYVGYNCASSCYNHRKSARLGRYIRFRWWGSSNNSSRGAGGGRTEPLSADVDGEEEPLLPRKGGNSRKRWRLFYTSNRGVERHTDDDGDSFARADTEDTTTSRSSGSGNALKDKHFSIEELKLVDKNGNPHGVVEVVRRGFWEQARVILEVLCCGVQLFIHLLMVLKYCWPNSRYRELFPLKGLLVGAALWGWLTGVSTLRLLHIDDCCRSIKGKYPGNLWAGSFVCYMVMFFSSVLPFRSVYVKDGIEYVESLFYRSQFYLDGTLFLLLFTATVGNEHGMLYRTFPDVTPSPEPVVSLASFISWSWLDRFIWKSHLTPVKLEDIWGLRLDDYAIYVTKRFNRFIEAGKREKRKFSRNLVLFFTPYFLLQAFWACLGAFTSFIPTILLQRVLEYVEDRSTAPANLAWLYIIGMFVCRVAVAVFQAQALFFGRRVCIRMKAVIISEIYGKALRRRISRASSGSAAESVDAQKANSEVEIDGDEESKSANLGAIINLMAVDAFKISEICAYLHAFVEAFIMTIIAMVLLYRLIGWSACVGAAVMILLLPLNFKLANLIASLQRETLAQTDLRIQKLNETFQAIRIIKFFAWEDNFEREIHTIRERELEVLVKRAIVWSLSSFVWLITLTLVSSVAFIFYIYVQKQVLTTPVAFTALSLFTLLRNPLDQISDMLSYVIQSMVSLDRVQVFLNEAETSKYDELTIRSDRLGFENATISWESNGNSFKLKNLDLNFKVGKLNVIIGPTGSGKTSLLMGLLGEMNLLEGKIYVPSLDPRDDLVIQSDGMTNSIAYCSQAAWLLNDTVRNNITFNAHYDEERYQSVIEACGLKRDFEILSAGDQTEIGEKGITLSGGQKQRVSLARALYSNAKHLLLDDCLSAVDSHTALWIYENCISGPLMENRTCILVSHNIALTLKNADWVVILENGRIKDQGEPLDLMNKGKLGEDELVKSSLMSRNASSVNVRAGMSNKSTIDLYKANKAFTDVKESTRKKKFTTEDDRIKAGKLIGEETKSEGVVSLDIYLWFAKLFGGFKTVFFLFIIFLLVQVFSIGQSLWVRKWVAIKSAEFFAYVGGMLPSKLMNVVGTARNAVQASSWYATLSYVPETTKVVKHSSFYYLSIYFLIGGVSALAASLKTIVNFLAGLNASMRIFNLVLKKVLYARLRFFDSTPIGRIMNRFSKDVEAIDQELTPYVEGAFGSLCQCLSTIILIAYITPGFLIVAVFICFMYYLVGYFYMVGSRELKRFESITKSPIHQHFSETLVGITTIRAYGDERRFLMENLQKIDENNKPFFYLWVANRWLAFRIDLIGAVVILASGVFILLNVDSLDAGLAGVSLTYAISFTEGALWFIRLYSTVEMTMNSVERLKEYMAIEQEPSNEGIITPPQEWPSKGKVEVNDLSLRYAPGLPKVIKNVTFTVEPQSKVGIVGRTGAGKSTIVTAVFRFLEPDTGSIKLDGIDITTVGLKRLRQSITIIPQDPVLFTGTIRSNLDPYGEYSDGQIFESLKRVNLIEDGSRHAHNTSSESSIHSENWNKFLDLESEISEGGSNLSQGQRQLVCLARSLLRCPKMIMLDEATASIDYASDAKIQQTIREEFSASTILTIAHRLRSIIDYDKVLVMDAGEVKEYDHPYSLLLNKESIFYNMCEDSGELEVLLQLAKEAFVKKLNSK